MTHHMVQNWHSSESLNLAKLLLHCKALYLHITMPTMLDTNHLQSYLHRVNPETYHNAQYACHIHMTLITSLTVVKYQHNTTPRVCGKSKEQK